MGTATTPNIGAFRTVAMRGTRYSGGGYKKPENNNNDNWGFFIVFVIVLGTILCLTSCDNKNKELIVHTSDKYKVTTLGINNYGRLVGVSYNNEGNVYVFDNAYIGVEVYVKYIGTTTPFLIRKYTNGHEYISPTLYLPLDYQIPLMK
jgi:hypothetical protein